MDMMKTTEVILSFVKKSNLNYQIQESPFSIAINLRKTFVKNRKGDDLQPSSDFFVEVDTLKHKVKVENLEEENVTLRTTLDQLEAELQDAKVALHDMSMKVEKSNIIRMSCIRSTKSLSRKSLKRKLKLEI